MTTILHREPGSEGTRLDWKTTGWQGLTLQTPDGWDMVGYSGDARTGSLRIDNGGAGARTATGMELRWSTPKGILSQPDLQKRLDSYFAGITKSARRDKREVETKSKAVQEEMHPERGVFLTFSWRSDRRAVGRIWHCRDCGRVVVAQVTGGLGGDWTSTANDALRSLECHPVSPVWKTWSLYDLQTQIPADYDLKGKPQLMNIYVQLSFGLGHSLDAISVEQWGIANMQLRGAYLNEWYRAKNVAQLATLSYEELETEVQGHPALQLTGRRAGLTYWAGQGLPHLVRLQRPAIHFAACLWECPFSNKTYLVQSFSRRPQPDLIQEIVGRTSCHC